MVTGVSRVEATAPAHAAGSGRRVPVGRISGVFGVRGWVRIFSYTEPRANVLQYNPWILRRDDGERTCAVLDGHEHGAGVVASLDGVGDRDAAAALVGCEVEVDRSQLGPAGPGQYYWADLEGMAVVTTDGVPLGRITRLFATGANDVMVVQGERRYLLPFVHGRVVRQVDEAARAVTVDWDPAWTDA
jgi:16S rRNA processing protein RimM